MKANTRTTTTRAAARPASLAPTRATVINPAPSSRESEEHRRFPRSEVAVKFELSVLDDDEDVAFQASLMSTNLSVSGVFLQSTFFLAVSQEVRVHFILPGEHQPVKARALIVREDRSEQVAASGFALKFLEFYDQSEIALAKLFLGERLARFAQEYLESKRAKELTSELKRLVEALAAWELLKVTSDRDVWLG